MIAIVIVSLAGALCVTGWLAVHLTTTDRVPHGFDGWYRRHGHNLPVHSTDQPGYELSAYEAMQQALERFNRNHERR